MQRPLYLVSLGHMVLEEVREPFFRFIAVADGGDKVQISVENQHRAGIALAGALIIQRLCLLEEALAVGIAGGLQRVRQVNGIEELAQQEAATH